MQKTLSQNGGMPLYIEHLLWMQDAYFEGFKAVYGGYAKQFDGNLIISGCVGTLTSPNTYDFTEGFCLIDYEIRFLRAQTGVTISNPLQAFFVAFDAPNPAGNFIFEDTIPKDTFQDRNVAIQSFTTTPTVPAVPAFLPQVRLENIIPSVDFTPEHDTLSYQNSFAPTTVGGQLPTPNQVLVQKHFGIITFRGQIDGGTVGNVMFTVGAAFRPTVQGLSFICPYGSDGLVKVDILSTGTVRPVAVVVAPSSGTTIDLSNISYTVK